MFGLKSVTMIEQGREVSRQDLEDLTVPRTVHFSATPLENTWYSFIIEDIDGKVAYTNPVWVTVTD